MRLLFIYMMFAGLLINATSCKKTFLDVEDNSILLREQYVNDINTLQQYMNGVYVLMARDFYHASFATGGAQIYAEIVADNVKATNTSSVYYPYHTWSQNPLSNNMSNLWLNGYQMIRSSSFVVDKSNEIKSENEIKANHLQGEAYVIRALGHFVLVNVFAQAYNFTPDASHLGIPYVSSWDWNDPVKRNTLKEVYEGMINDLKAAIELLPVSNSNKTIMNHYTAKALLARVYLFKEDWELAKKYAIEVANAVPLLAANLYPAKLFTPDESEALFQLVPSSTTAVPGSYTTTFQGLAYRTALLANKDIADLLTSNPNDSRKIWISSGGIGKDSVRKYPSGVLPNFGTGTNPHRAYFATLFRSSEMFLTIAEAAANLGDEVTARKYLDDIRKRANPSAVNSIANGAALMDSIYLERRKELAFEGLRMFDLLRWKKGVNRIDATIGAPLSLPYPSDRAISPIPQKDVNYGLSQNPSY